MSPRVLVAAAAGATLLACALTQEASEDKKAAFRSVDPHDPRVSGWASPHERGEEEEQEITKVFLSGIEIPPTCQEEECALVPNHLACVSERYCADVPSRLECKRITGRWECGGFVKTQGVSMSRMKMVCDPQSELNAWRGCTAYVSMRGPWTGYTKGAEWTCYLLEVLALIALFVFVLLMLAESNKGSKGGGSGFWYWGSTSYAPAAPHMSWVREA